MSTNRTYKPPFNRRSVDRLLRISGIVVFLAVTVAGASATAQQPRVDCNNNGVPDEIDIANQTSKDCNTNGVPDECERCGGPNDIPCPEGQFCQFCTGECDVPDNFGACADLGGFCPGVIDPVCGCDGVTYTNTCFAAVAGVSLAWPGPCTVDCCLPDRTCTENSPPACVSEGGVSVSACLGDGDGNGGDDACGSCYLAAAPETDIIIVLGNSFPNKKVRHLSFSTSDVGRLQALRVVFQDLPEPYDTWNGTIMWVRPPARYCERSGQLRPPGCSSPREPSLPWEYWGATLGCDPYFADWAEFGVVHVFHEGIVPDAAYLVQAIDLSCHMAGIPDYSAPLIAETSRWGDTVADCTTTPCGAPNDSPGIVDVVAVLDKFLNLPGCVQKVRADLEGSPAGDPRVPDQVINITDVVYCLGAFLGETYPAPGFPGPSPPPCQP